MSNINDKIRQIAKETEPELIHIRRELHQYPELGIDLPKTHEIISRELHKIPGLKIREHVAGGYGLIAELQGKKEQGKKGGYRCASTGRKSGKHLQVQA